MSGKKREKSRIRKAEKRKSRRLPGIVSLGTLQTKSSFEKDEVTEVGDTEHIEASDGAKEQSETVEEESKEAGERILGEEPAQVPVAEHETENDIPEDAAEEEKDMSVVEVVPEDDMPSEDSPPEQEIRTVSFSSREIPEKCPFCDAPIQVFRMSSTHKGQAITRTMVSPCNCGNYFGFIDPPI